MAQRYGPGKCGYCGDWVSPDVKDVGRYILLSEVEDLLEQKKQLLPEIQALRSSFTADYDEGRIDMLRAVIRDLEQIVNGPKEIL